MGTFQVRQVPLDNLFKPSGEKTGMLNVDTMPLQHCASPLSSASGSTHRPLAINAPPLPHAYNACARVKSPLDGVMSTFQVRQVPRDNLFKPSILSAELAGTKDRDAAAAALTALANWKSLPPPNLNKAAGKKRKAATASTTRKCLRARVLSQNFTHKLVALAGQKPNPSAQNGPARGSGSPDAAQPLPSPARATTPRNAFRFGDGKDVQFAKAARAAAAASQSLVPANSAERIDSSHVRLNRQIGQGSFKVVHEAELRVPGSVAPTVVAASVVSAADIGAEAEVVLQERAMDAQLYHDFPKEVLRGHKDQYKKHRTMVFKRKMLNAPEKDRLVKLRRKELACVYSDQARQRKAQEHSQANVKADDLEKRYRDVVQELATYKAREQSIFQPRPAPAGRVRKRTHDQIDQTDSTPAFGVLEYTPANKYILKYDPSRGKATPREIADAFSDDPAKLLERNTDIVEAGYDQNYEIDTEEQIELMPALVLQAKFAAAVAKGPLSSTQHLLHVSEIAQHNECFLNYVLASNLAIGINRDSLNADVVTLNKEVGTMEHELDRMVQAGSKFRAELAAKDAELHALKKECAVLKKDLGVHKELRAKAMVLLGAM